MSTDYCEIPLTNGGVALVDVEDRELVEGYKWYGNNHGAYCSYKYEWGWTSITMHSLITGRTTRKIHLKHVNGNIFDNRKSNLQIHSRELVLVKCSNCDKEFLRFPAAINPTNNYHSRECMGLHRRKPLPLRYKSLRPYRRDKVIVPCFICGSPLERKSHELKFESGKALAFCNNGYCVSAFLSHTRKGNRPIYNQYFSQRLIEWRGNTCAFPSCPKSFRDWHSRKWPLCREHSRRFTAILVKRNKETERLIGVNISYRDFTIMKPSLTTPKQPISTVRKTRRIATAEDKKQILSLYGTEGNTLKSLAKQFDLHYSTISRIVNQIARRRREAKLWQLPNTNSDSTAEAIHAASASSPLANAN